MPSITTSVAIGSGPMMVQNLGPGNLYVQDVSPATTTVGTKISVGSAAVLKAGESYYAVSDSTSDTRLLGRGEGFFSSTV